LSVRAEEAEQMRRRSVSFLLVASLAGGLVSFGVSTASALSTVEGCFFSSMNNERAAVGHPRLVLESDLIAVARRHSGHMAADGTIYHNQNLANEVGGQWWVLGENVGMGPSCQAIHDAFMASPEHRSNILDTDYNQVGVGVAVKDGTIYVTEDFAGRTFRGSSWKKPSFEPKPRPASRRLPEPEPRTVPILLTLIGMDAARIDTATGRALGV
jgi:uncharacterized protein YkwD